MSTIIMNTTTAQRRGKHHLKAATETTAPQQLVVADGHEDSSKTIRRATVRRNFVGTGPFDQHWLNLDCCGLFCAMFTYILHGYGVYAVCWVLLPPWMSSLTEDGVRHLTVAGLFHQTAFCAIAVVACISHFMAMTTDPGAVPPDAKPLPPIPAETTTTTTAAGESSQQQQQDKEKEGLLAPSNNNNNKPEAATRGKKLCRRCRAFKPQRAHHCSICRRCIIKMDHHCPWVNNCVGIGNHKYFLLFVFYTCLSCLYSLLLVVVRFATCVEPRSNHTHHHHHVRHSATMTCLDRPTQLLTILGLMIESILFAMFTMCMIGDQASVVFSKMTHIDRLKGVDIGGSLAGIQEVFGVSGGVNQHAASRFRPDWLSPFARVCFPPSVRDEVMGFCRPCHQSTVLHQPSPASNTSSSAAAAGGLKTEPGLSLAPAAAAPPPSANSVGGRSIVSSSGRGDMV